MNNNDTLHFTENALQPTVSAIKSMARTMVVPTIADPTIAVCQNPETSIKPGPPDAEAQTESAPNPPDKGQNVRSKPKEDRLVKSALVKLFHRHDYIVYTIR